MLAGISVILLVVIVGLLVAGDFARTERESVHWSDDRLANDASPRAMTEAHDGSAFLREPAGHGVPAAAPEAGPGQRPGAVSPSAGSSQRSRDGRPAGHSGPRRGLKDWRVRTRLLLLVIVPSVGVAVVAFCIVRIGDATRSASVQPPGSSGRDRDI